MRKLVPKNLPDTKIYFTEADPSSQSYYEIGFSLLDVKIKFWLLLFEHVIISTNHMLFSDLTYKWLTEDVDLLNELVNDNAIIPSLREGLTNINDYLNKKDISQCDAPEKVITSKHVLLERASILNDIFPNAITWSPISESTLFREGIVNDLLRSDSPLRKRMKGISLKNIEKTANEISKFEYLNREGLAKILRTCLPQRERLLLKYSDILYYLSGAIHKNAFPALHGKAMDLCADKIKYDIRSSYSDYKGRNDIWKEIIDIWGITKHAL